MTFEVAYHKFLKRILDVPTYTTNHLVAEICNQFLFEHHIALSQARFYKRITVSPNPLVKVCLPWLKIVSQLSFIKSVFYDKYNVNISKCSLDVLRSRVTWIQIPEPRRDTVWL